MSRTQALLSEWTATFVLGMLAVGGGSVVALAAGSHPALGRWAPYLAFGLLLFGAGGVAISSR
ncbi:MAG: hypothetical protein JWP41_4370, partial [Ramlibacter sp.]|nr:hypothetical protein [Ramlibacter sp.]